MVVIATVLILSMQLIPINDSILENSVQLFAVNKYQSSVCGTWS